MAEQRDYLREFAEQVYAAKPTLHYRPSGRKIQSRGRLARQLKRQWWLYGGMEN